MIGSSSQELSAASSNNSAFVASSTVSEANDSASQPLTRISETSLLSSPSTEASAAANVSVTSSDHSPGGVSPAPNAARVNVVTSIPTANLVNDRLEADQFSSTIHANGNGGSVVGLAGANAMSKRDWQTTMRQARAQTLLNQYSPPNDQKTANNANATANGNAAANPNFSAVHNKLVESQAAAQSVADAVGLDGFDSTLDNRINLDRLLVGTLEFDHRIDRYH